MASSVSTSGGTPLGLTKEQANAVIHKHLRGQDRSTLRKLTEIQNKGYSYTSNAKTYILDLSPAHHDESIPPSSSCFITIQHPRGDDADAYHTNALPEIHRILSHIRSKTNIPIPDPILDTTHELVPFDLLLCPPSPITSTNIIPLSVARKSGYLNEAHAAFVDLEIGRFLGQLHSGVQNDWFGLPHLDAPPEPSYSWQETFTHLLETLLSEFQAAGVELPYEEIRQYLSRAIAFFLFDDVEVPSLIWLTGSEDDIYISLPSHPATKTRGIVAILPTAAHALWGDPLLESFFIPPAPSQGVLEGYVGSGGTHLTLFPRQKTKRLWYTVFLALLALKERRLGGVPVDDSEVTERWALDIVKDSTKLLANAPCY
ncbi:hypothetical protein BDN70DRAFT_665096 [Pholiota conissans]|uniref:Aminoglycoside phosphotransferase domain-containing protein n=1 Tax=Pholiota conissans TaxID=109636 RepID=A0A9P5Z1T9_9AGAR|nr:hypothetical protein BDN70DRAFT_665096 [Pholiota conissans]